MKRFAMLFAGLAVLAASAGCCCMGSPCGPCGYGYGGYAPSPCGPGGCSPYGAVVAPTSAYYVPTTTITAAAPIYPMTAVAPVQILPTY
jgi:hypothetical protein